VLILLDENLLSKKLKKPFLDAGHIVQNVEDMGWRGTKDRELLALANAFPFEPTKTYPTSKICKI
jgi:hypothetical protein